MARHEQSKLEKERAASNRQARGATADKAPSSGENNKRSSKRTEIQQVATQVVYENGFRATTLADVAKAANIPVGSVYYYFKTKNELGEAIISHLLGRARAKLEEFGAMDCPCDRLVQFVGMTKSAREDLVLFGCPIGSLCAEFGKDFPELLGKAGGIYAVVIDWMAAQFAQIVPEQNARTLACQLMASLEGIALVAQGLGDAEVVAAETARLTTWIKSL
jgi:AcrR family transcriptional regulator